MTPEQSRDLLEEVYHTVDRYAVASLVVGSDNVRDKGGYVVFRCPQCGQMKGYIRKPDGKYKGITAHCSRATCTLHEPMTLIDFVAGHRRARGEDFKRSLARLANIVGLSYGDYKPMTADERKRLLEKIKARVPKDYYAPKPQYLKVLRWYEAGLAASPAEAYLKKRRIPLTLARSFRAGFARKGKWCHRKDGKLVRQWYPGRIVFPTWTVDGQPANLYGRAVELGRWKTGKKYKHLKHDFLPGAKGYGYLGKDIEADRLHIVEGFFDLLAFKAAFGDKAAIAVFGCHVDWKSIRASRVCLCFDTDVTGSKAWHKLAQAAKECGKEVYFLKRQTYKSHKDLAEVYESLGKIELTYKKY